MEVGWTEWPLHLGFGVRCEGVQSSQDFRNGRGQTAITTGELKGIGQEEHSTVTT